MLLGVRYRLEYKLEADNKSPVARVEEVKGLNGAEEKRRGAWGKGEREQRYFTGFACGRTLIIFVPSGMAGLILSRSAALNEALQGRQAGCDERERESARAGGEKERIV